MCCIGWFYMSTWLQHPHIWSNIILGVSLRVCPNENKIGKLPSRMWVGLKQSLEGLNKTKTDLSKQDIIQPAECLHLGCISSLSILFASLPCGFWIHQASKFLSQFLKINLSFIYVVPHYRIYFPIPNHNWPLTSYSVLHAIAFLYWFALLIN